MGMIMKDGIPYGGIYPIDDAPTQGSNNAVKSGGVFSSLSNKVDKIAGKGLSTNDYDNTEKGKVADNTSAIELLTGNAPNDITARVSNLPTAVAQQNLEKYGYKIGDYFDGSVSGYRYWLGQLDYNYVGYDTYAVLGSHNIGLVVDTKTYSKWNTTNDMDYENSTLHTYLKGAVLDNIKADMDAMFGSWSDHLLAESKQFPLISDWKLSASPEHITALTEVQVIGYPQMSVDKFQQGEGDNQLDIFRKYKYNRIFGNNNVWLRSIASSSTACVIYYGGIMTYSILSGDYLVAGLILFH